MIENKNYNLDTEEAVIDCESKFDVTIFKSAPFLAYGRMDVLLGTRYATEMDPIANVRNRRELRDDFSKSTSPARFPLRSRWYVRQTATPGSSPRAPFLRKRTSVL
jgi:hypothetical protein